MIPTRKAEAFGEKGDTAMPLPEGDPETVIFMTSSLG